MKIAVIAPTAFLDVYGVLGDDYHLCLSDLVLNDKRYAQFYRARAAQGEYVILDNSAHEQLEGDSLGRLCDAVVNVRPSEIVLPDRLFFGDDTLDRSTEAYAVLRRAYPYAKLMGVPQGRTGQEWRRCLIGLLRLGVDTIGISKDYEVWADGRGLYSLVRIVRSIAPNVAIHMLGWGRQLHHIQPLAHMVRGIDSAKPLVYALSGVRLPDVITSRNLPKYPRRQGQFFEATEIQDDIARHNINVFRTCATDQYTARTAVGT